MERSVPLAPPTGVGGQVRMDVSTSVVCMWPCNDHPGGSVTPQEEAVRRWVEGFKRKEGCEGHTCPASGNWSWRAAGPGGDEA